MMIDRIGHTEPIPSGKRPEKSEPVTRGLSSDSISLSPEALERAEIYQVTELASAAPDVRTGLVMELKAKIDDPSYINSRLDATADALMNLFGI
jgi:negative regulator of flagellin synthesis FlgM